MENEEVSEYADTMEEAKEVMKSLNLESIDTALLILIYQTLDQIRFHNSD